MVGEEVGQGEGDHNVGTGPGQDDIEEGSVHAEFIPVAFLVLLIQMYGSGDIGAHNGSSTLLSKGQ